MGTREFEDRNQGVRVPAIGDRIEGRRGDVVVRGRVHYADSVQILVKWDDGSSSSLRVGRDDFRIVAA
jgi:hypothetical protein